MNLGRAAKAIIAFVYRPSGRIHFELDFLLAKVFGDAADLLVNVGAAPLRSANRSYELIYLEINLLRVLKHLHHELMRHLAGLCRRVSRGIHCLDWVRMVIKRSQ